jgi:outer membrane immunogenic protein
MSRAVFLGIGLAAMAVLPAAAADLPVKAPPMAVSGANWTGFYIGVEGGGAWARATQTDNLPFSSGTYNPNGGLIGGTVGYNMQLNQFVLGIEGDGSWTWIKGSTRGTDPASGNCGGVPSHCESNLQALGTLRARAGLTWNNVLLYATGGLAVGSLHGNEGDIGIPGNGAFGSGTATVAGWTIGAGVEMMLWSNWSAKAEYLHVDLGNHGIFTDTLPGAGGQRTESIRYTAEVFRVGLNYRFGGGPVVARY